MVDLPEGWRRAGRIEAWRLGRNMRRKIGPGHVLADTDFKIVALHQDGDDFLVAANEAPVPYYVLHVSRRKEAAGDAPAAYPLMDLSELSGEENGEDYLEDTQIFLLDQKDTTEPVALELWVNPVAPVRCEKIVIFSGGAFNVVPLIGEEIRLANGSSLTMVKSVLATKGYVMADGPLALALEGDSGPEETGQAISFWVGNEEGERTIWSVLETPGEEFSMQRVDGDLPSVLFFSSFEEVENALRNRGCEFVDGRVGLTG